MLTRTLEPEVMDTAEEAREYDTRWIIPQSIASSWMISSQSTRPRPPDLFSTLARGRRRFRSNYACVIQCVR